MAKVTNNDTIVDIFMIKKMAATCVMKKQNNLCNQVCNKCSTCGAHFIDIREWTAAMCEAETDWFNAEYRRCEEATTARFDRYYREKAELDAKCEEYTKLRLNRKIREYDSQMGWLRALIFIGLLAVAVVMCFMICIRLDEVTYNPILSMIILVGFLTLFILTFRKCYLKLEGYYDKKYNAQKEGCKIWFGYDDRELRNKHGI
jgi:hypothetical protein